jgi:hypothetical protein
VPAEFNTDDRDRADPFTELAGTLFSDFLQPLNGLNDSGGAPCFAGYCDWRIPTRGELRSIPAAQYPATCPSALCMNAMFGPTQMFEYWSSSSSANIACNAWGIVIFNALIDSWYKVNGLYARAVRSGR